MRRTGNEQSKLQGGSPDTVGEIRTDRNNGQLILEHLPMERTNKRQSEVENAARGQCSAVGQ